MTKEVVKKLFVTTSWDDGDILDLKLAKLLRKYDIMGTFYIPKSCRSNPLEQRDIVMLDNEFEVGAHSLTHTDLTAISLQDVRKEIEGSKKYLEELLNHSVLMFCYPKGCYNEKIKNVVKNSGFIGARTCVHGRFDFPQDPYEWQIGVHASNGSPLMSLRIWLNSHISIKSLLDWEIRAKLLFNLAMQKGGVYHLWGHSWEFEQNNTWDKLEQVLKYISHRADIQYMTNSEILKQHLVKGESDE